MKQEQKSELARQRILDAALTEFGLKGYEGASLNAACAENGISKGIVYHHFKDKNELYLLCVQTCFQALTAYLERELRSFSGTAEARVQHFVGAQVRFFGENPRYLGIFCDASLRPPEELREEILSCRTEFEKLNLSVLSELLKEKPLRASLSPQAAAEDYLGYLQYFHLRFRNALRQGGPQEQILLDHEEKCHRQLDVLLHGILGESK